jgi:cell division initiation protein
MNNDELLWRRVFLALEALIMENKELKDALNRSEGMLNEYRDMDRSIRETIVNAVALGEDHKNNARKEAELILEEARLKAKQVEGEQTEEKGRG